MFIMLTLGPKQHEDMK